jgi:hypothetical protein
MALERLDLSGNRLTSTLPAEMAQMSNLTDVFLEDNQLTGPLPETFMALRDCWYVAHVAGTCFRLGDPISQPQACTYAGKPC